MTYKRGLVGGLSLVVGIDAMKLAYNSDYSGYILARAIARYILGAIVLIHGLFYLLSDNWLPYPKYLLSSSPPTLMPRDKPKRTLRRTFGA
jgi:hypothetical protein